jgi:DNA polymerase I-like protein with 3'-5' exonuclease and polymerase domains
MIVNVDVVGLEVVCAAFLAQDKVLIKELTDKEDIHSNNQKAFNLPSRLVAKVLKFRLLYGGSEFSFAKDPDFTPVSTSQKYWRKVIDRYYEKYSGIAAWHNGLLATVSRTKKLEMPTGRIYNFDLVKGFNGELKLPETTIKNYPVNLAA